MGTRKIRLLGTSALTYDGASLNGAVAGRRQCPLAHLLLHREPPQSRQGLAFLFFPDPTEDQAFTGVV